jgi:hypothetical protein
MARSRSAPTAACLRRAFVQGPRVDGTRSDPSVREARERRCDLGYLRQPMAQDGDLVYNCLCEPESTFSAVQAVTRGEPAGFLGRALLGRRVHLCGRLGAGLPG